MNFHAWTSRHVCLLATLGILFMISNHANGGEADVIPGWQLFERQVRDDLIPYEDGLAAIRHWGAMLQRTYPPGQFEGRIFFPVKGYGLKHVGGRRGEGYRPSRYEFIGPKRRIGHPAQDIFVYDGNQDSIDDRTGSPFEVLAMAEGIVVSTLSDWMPLPLESGNGKRGGNYIWIYHPALRLFSYYAHLQAVGVRIGERVVAGQPIAALGRTGTNAAAERSPTHLHLMLLRAGDMTPVNPYPLLAMAADGRGREVSSAAGSKKAAPKRVR